MAAFTVGAFSMIGIPPTCGFFSKWYLILGAIDAGQWGFMTALLISSLINVVLFFRVIEFGYYEPMSDHHHHEHEVESTDEAPVSMLVPLWIVALSLIGIGLFTSKIVTNFIQYVIPKGI